MVSYKIGDLVRHKPTGCVAILQRHDEFTGVLSVHGVGVLSVHGVSFNDNEAWIAADCELYRDPTRVIAWARDVVAHSGMLSMVNGLAEALSEYFGKNEVKQCDECVHHGLTMPNATGQQTTVCHSAKVLNPYLGMKGCNFKAKNNL